MKNCQFEIAYLFSANWTIFKNYRNIIIWIQDDHSDDGQRILEDFSEAIDAENVATFRCNNSPVRVRNNISNRVIANRTYEVISSAVSIRRVGRLNFIWGALMTSIVFTRNEELSFRNWLYSLGKLDNFQQVYRVVAEQTCPLLSAYLFT